MKHILFTLLILVISMTAFAGDESKRIADQIAPLLNENVVAVGHVDLDKIDVTKLDVLLQALLNPKEPGELVDAYKAKLEKLSSPLRDRNIRDVYFLFIPSVSLEYPLLAFPLTKKMDANDLNQMATEWDLPGEPFVLQNFVLPYPELRQQASATMMLNLPATPRPELLAALETMEDAAVKVAVIPSVSARKVIAETVDTLPSPFAALPLPVLLDGVNWAALGVDLDRATLNLVLKSKHEQAALEFRTGLEKNIDAWLAESNQNAEFILLQNMVQALGGEVGTFLKSLLPVQKNDRLFLTIDGTFLEERAKIFPAFQETLAGLVFQQYFQTECKRNLMQIMIALHNYNDRYLKLPSAWTVDKEGKPLHSWRVAILPYIEQSGLYNSIRLDEPWDSEYNKQFHHQCPAIFQCPAAAAKNPAIEANGLTTYSVIVGKNAFPEGGKKYEFAMITDGTSCTWSVVERATPVCWMDPTQEIVQDEAEKGIGRSAHGIAAPHPTQGCYGTNVAFFDGSARFYAENLSLKSVRLFITRNGGEAMQEEYDALPGK